jgi:hypothetical protein
LGLVEDELRAVPILLTGGVRHQGGDAKSLTLSALVGIVFCAVAMGLRVPYSDVLGADGTTAALAADYLLWFIPAMALQFGMVSMAAALRGTPDRADGNRDER